MSNNVETKPTITFDEFRAWLTGLIRGMDGKLPGVEEWKQIKQMMDKVQPEVREVQNPAPSPTHPLPMPVPSEPYWPKDRWPYQIWCGDSTSRYGNNTGDLTNITHTHTNGDPVTNTEGQAGKPCGVGEQLNLAIDQMVQNNSD